MKNVLIILYKATRLLYRIFKQKIDYVRTAFLFLGNGVDFHSFKTTGVPFISIARGATCSIGKGLSMHNSIYGNPIGCAQKCNLFVDSGCSLHIGENVGISQVAIVAHADIIIGDNVKIGGGTCIYTSDFHSLESKIRQNPALDELQKKNLPVKIYDNVFIGAHCIILKGVSVGSNSIIGAGSVVTKDIPANQIWAGNPAHFIREVN